MTLIFVFGLFTINLCVGKIHLAKGILKKHREAMNRDLELLDKLSLPRHSKLTNILETRFPKEWIEKRVSYIIAPKLKWWEDAFFFERSVIYPEGDLDLIEKVSSFGSTDNERMENIGAVLYMDGKAENDLMGITLHLKDGPKVLEVNSPRIGVIKLGHGLFIPEELPNEENEKAKSNSYNRLATLFHEGRHSDGHGDGLAFAHVVCPEEHDMRGLFACDAISNGPYAIGALMLEEFIKKCTHCTKDEKMMLVFQKLDYESRVLESKKMWDPTPEYLAHEN